MSLTKSHQKQLLDLLSVPTAPFREDLVRQFCVEQLNKWKVPYCEDEVGNLIVGVNSLKAYERCLNRRDKEPVRVFVAHMDHPGFHVDSVSDAGSLNVTWYGGSPVKHLAGAKMWLADAQGFIGYGKLSKPQRHELGYCITKAVVVPNKNISKQRLKDPEKLYGGFGFRKPAWMSGQRIYTQCADDLVGVFSILQTAKSLFSKKTNHGAFIGLLTRAEEVGFVGMIAHLESERLTSTKRNVMIVSLEASRTLPNAEVGKGPIIRLGDRRSNFNPDGTQLLTNLAERTLKGAYQRRIMDGGACEATAATVFGLKTIGITVPLGNYHNEGYDGGAGCKQYRGPAPEYVHSDDVSGMVKLCRALMRKGLPWGDAWKPVRDRLQKNRRHYRKLLGA